MNAFYWFFMMSCLNFLSVFSFFMKIWKFTGIAFGNNFN